MLECVVVVLVAGARVAASSRVVVVVVVAGLSDSHELRNIMAKTESNGVRMISFFIVCELILPRKIRRKLLSQMFYDCRWRRCTPSSAAKAKLQCPGFQIEIKENKTPGGEQWLDPPGAELLAWL